MYKAKGKLKLVLVMLLVGLTISGCNLFKSAQKKIMPSNPQPKKAPLKIGVSMATTEGDGYVLIKQRMDKLKKQQKVEITWQDAKNDPLEQVAQIDALVKAKVKAVVFQPVDPKQTANLVEKLQQKKIKVVALERLPINTPVDGYITPDYSRAGELQAQAVAKQVKSGQVLVLAGDQDQNTAQEMLKSFLQSLQAKGIIQVVSVNPQGYLDPDTAKEVVQTGLKRYPHPKAIVTQDPALNQALLDYLKVNPMTPKPFTVGIGADKATTKALMSGKHDAEVDIRPDLLAQYAFKAATQLAKDGHLDYDQKVTNGESDVPVKSIPVRLVRKDNIYLLQEMWGKALAKPEKKPAAKEQSQGQGGDQKSSEHSSDQSGGQGGKGGQQGKGKMTKLKITTQEGKTMEIEVPGDVQKIETKSCDQGEQKAQSGQDQGQNQKGEQ